MPKHRIFTTAFCKVYPLYVQKAERKNRTKDEVDQIIRWLTGYSQAGLEKQIKQQSDFENFFPKLPLSIQIPRSSKGLCVVSAWKK